MGRWSLTAAVVNSVIGSGVFGLPSALAALAGTWSPALVLVAGASIFIIVLCFAEVGSRFDDAGGPYLYTREAFGSAAGFYAGWLLLFGRLLSAAAALNILVAYLSPLSPFVASPAGRVTAMTVAVLTVTAINVRGVRTAAWTTNAFTVAKLLPLVLLVALGCFRISPDILATQVVAQPDWREALLLLVFVYGGFEAAVVAASETRDPRRDTAFALVAATVAVTAIYALLQLVVVGVLPNAGTDATPVASTLGRLLGPAGATIASIGVVVSVYGWLTGFTLMMPRVLYSMAGRGELPSMLGFVHARFRTPSNAIVVNAVIALAMGLYSSFTQAAVLAAIVRLVIFIMTCGALIALRRRGTSAPGFLAPCGVLLAAAGITFSVWLLSTRNLAQAWIFLIVLGAGALVRAWSKAPLSSPEPEP